MIRECGIDDDARSRPNKKQRPAKRLEYRGLLKTLQVLHWKGFTLKDRAQVLVCQPLMASHFSSGF
jgi:hypothetical protein